MNISAFLAAAPRGTAASIARALGVHPVMVSQWAAGKQVATEQCPQIERATAGAVTVQEMRPDVRWYRVADPEWPHPDGRPLIDVARPAAEVAAPRTPEPEHAQGATTNAHPGDVFQRRNDEAVANLRRAVGDERRTGRDRRQHRDGPASQRERGHAR